MEQAMKELTFVTSNGSSIAPFILKKVIKRIERQHNYSDIINEELRDIVDYGSEAEEIYDYCLEALNNSKNEPISND